MKTLVINFGALADTLADQILSQGLIYKDAARLDHFQQDANAISRLSIRGYLSDSIAKNCRAKLMKKINMPKATP